MKYPDDYINKVACGDALTLLKDMPDQVVQTCITSPPYWGLRDYGVDGQLGLEDTPEQYVSKVVELFREVRRVLKDDGTLWVNIGDSYAAGGRNSGNSLENTSAKQLTQISSMDCGPKKAPKGMKPKDLVGIPWMVAFALRADGWYLRSDIIWSKPNPMPESVTDRPTKAHEYLFLLSKSSKYYYDAEAIAEPVAESTLRDLRVPDDSNRMFRGYPGQASRGGTNLGNQATPTGWDTSKGNGGHGSYHRNGRNKDTKRVHGNKPGRSDGGRVTQRDKFSRSGPVGDHVLPNQTTAQHRPGREDYPPNGMRNKRSVWTIATQSFKEAHFATFPIKLVEPCILAGSKAGDIVMDPFMGSGTTALRAKELGRKYVGLELNPDYIKISDQRLCQKELF